MPSRLVHRIGHVQTLDGTRIHVVVIGALVRIHGDGTLTPTQAESFAQLYIRACWEAGYNAGATAEEEPADV
jgi:hypothetical protein